MVERVIVLRSIERGFHGLEDRSHPDPGLRCRCRPGVLTEKVGFALDHDHRPNETMRVVQMTPPGSACSVVIGEGMPLGEPGSIKGVQIVVDDLDEVRATLSGRGVPITEIQQLGPEGTPGSRFAFFDDPDGNTWAVQELKRS